MVGAKWRMTTVVAMGAQCRVDSVHVLTRDSALEMSGGRPLSSFDELLSMAVLTTSWWMLQMADMKLVLLSGSSASYCWVLGLNRPIRDSRRSAQSSGGQRQS